MADFKMYPTIITPFFEDGSIDYESLERLIDLFGKAGCTGIFAVCQSSEMFFLEEDEKLELARRSIAMCHQRQMKCIVSGHTQTAVDDQISYLRKLEDIHPDAIILVNNCLAAEDENEQTAVDTLHVICAALKPETQLGVYECPYPYKRLLSLQLIQAMVEDGRFRFIKDTSCRADLIKQRLELLKDTPIALFNANMATLGESMELGAAGYSGIQLNFMPEFFELLHSAYQNDMGIRVKRMLNYLSFTSTIENQNYPANAKYYLMRKGIIKTPVTRNGKPELTESQMKELDAFVATNAQAYAQFLPHEPQQLLFRYNAFFPECHASTILPLSDERVLVAYFAGTKEKDDDVGIWLSVRDRDVWVRPRLIAKVEQSAHWNPVLYQTEDAVRLIFKVGKTIDAWRSYTMASFDQGETWTKPEPMSTDHPANGPVRNKPILLSDGRWLGPNSDEGDFGWLPRIDESTDGGCTFHKLADIPVNLERPDESNYLAGKGAIQPTLWESKPGHIHALLRTTAGYVFRSDSTDYGKSWCTAYPTPVVNNNSGIDLACVGDALYLVLNPVGNDWGYRTPLIVMKSQDNGETFRDYCVLTDRLFDDLHKRAGQFCYPAIVAKDRTLYICYTWQRKSIAFCQIEV